LVAARPRCVAWAESAMMEVNFEENDFDMLRDVVSRIGLSDVKEFGISWTDCEEFLSRLGYRVSVLISEVPATV
jgi:hypothetical protein